MSLRDPRSRWELPERHHKRVGEHFIWLPISFLRVSSSSLWFVNDTVLVNLWSITAAPLLPTREGLKLGERTIAYLPRCADVSSEVRKVSTQVYSLKAFFIPFPD